MSQGRSPKVNPRGVGRIPKRKRVRWSQIVAVDYGEEGGFQDLEHSEAYVRGTIEDVLIVTVPRSTFLEGKAGEVNAALKAMFAKAGVEKDVVVLDEHVKFVKAVPVDLRVAEHLERQFKMRQLAQRQAAQSNEDLDG